MCAVELEDEVGWRGLSGQGSQHGDDSSQLGCLTTAPLSLRASFSFGGPAQRLQHLDPPVLRGLRHPRVHQLMGGQGANGLQLLLGTTDPCMLTAYCAHTLGEGCLAGLGQGWGSRNWFLGISG